MALKKSCGCSVSSPVLIGLDGSAICWDCGGVNIRPDYVAVTAKPDHIPDDGHLVGSTWNIPTQEP